MFQHSQRHPPYSHVPRILRPHRRSQRSPPTTPNNDSTGLTLGIDFHDILQVETKTIYKSGLASSTWIKNQANGAAEGGKKGKPKSQPIRKARKSDSFVMGFARVLAVLVIMLVAYFAYTAWRVNRGREHEYGHRYRRY